MGRPRNPVHDPLVSALIAKLPEAGGAFPREQREAWMRLMMGAFDMAYGPVGEIMVGQTVSAMQASQRAAEPAKPAVPLRPHQQAGSDVYVDDGGYVRSDVKRLLPDEIDLDEPVYDYRGAKRDRNTIIWADDTTGAVPGMSFCGPG